ncbi:MAG: phage shock protein E [Lysobacterales bacterium]|jgi:phage shock protein E
MPRTRLILTELEINRLAIQFILITSCFLLSVRPVLAGEEAKVQLGKEVSKVEVRGDIALAKQGWELLEQGALLIDVRSEEEFQSGTIEGSLNIAHSEIDLLAQAIGDELDRKVVLYCRSGKRAEKAKDQLEALGYTGIFNASGYDALMATSP